jgi:exodeoxyribonuclease VII small subunit
MTADEEPRYAEAMSELETILEQIDGEIVDIDQLGASVARAATLIELCRGRITSARAEVERVVKKLDDSSTRSNP